MLLTYILSDLSCAEPVNSSLHGPDIDLSDKFKSVVAGCFARCISVFQSFRGDYILVSMVSKQLITYV